MCLWADAWLPYTYTDMVDRALILVNVYVNRFAVYVYGPVLDSSERGGYLLFAASTRFCTFC